MTKITVEVMRTDIKSGQREKPKLCPIALAVNRFLKPRYKASVHSWCVTIYSGFSHEEDIFLPLRAKKFINAFDQNKAVEPFSFTIDIPEEFLR